MHLYPIISNFRNYLKKKELEIYSMSEKMGNKNYSVAKEY